MYGCECRLKMAVRFLIRSKLFIIGVIAFCFIRCPANSNVSSKDEEK
jgi:hypothetical protein